MSRRLHRPRGFTLVEVMLTTVLAAVLLLALWSLLSMYSKSFESGNARTEQAQIVRAVLDQVTSDLRNILVSPHEPVGLLPAAGTPQSSALSSASGSVSMPPGLATASPAAPPAPLSTSPRTATAVGPGQVAPPISAGAVPPLGGDPMPTNPAISTRSLRPPGLFGSSTSLQIDVVQPAMAPLHATSASVTSPAPGSVDSPPSADELRTVIYVFEEIRNPTGSQTSPQTRLVRREITWPQAHPAPDRAPVSTQSAGPLVGDPNPTTSAGSASAFGSATGASTSPDPPPAVSPADAYTSEGEELGPEALAIPEVLDFALRYFDGATWSDEWDSVERGGLPAAVEVSLRVRSADEPSGLPSNDPLNRPGVDREKLELLRYPVQRLLIPLAVAVAAPQETPDRLPADARFDNATGATVDGGYRP